MSFDLLLALLAFAVVTSITPGPNNLMLLASGTNFGARRSLPHALGVSLGHAVMVLGVGAGLMVVFDALPWMHALPAGAGLAYLLWLAWRLANAAPARPDAAPGRPLRWIEAAAFQWLNPKAWVMTLTAITLYAPGRDLSAVALVAAVFACVNLPSVWVWVVLGARLRRFLEDPVRLRFFNRAMALVLLLSTVPLFL